MTQGFRPFADDAAAMTVGGLEVENGTDRLAIHGSLDVTRDREGLARARRLRDVLDAAVAFLEAEPSLPERAAPPEAPREVRNPFS